MRKYVSNERGLTLSEVLVAITILGVAVVGLMGMFSTAQITYLGAGKETKALNLAQQKVEELRSKAWSEIKTEPDQITQPGIEFIAFPNPNQAYKYKVKVTQEGADLKTVVVTVRYLLGDTEKKIDITTKVSAR